MSTCSPSTSLALRMLASGRVKEFTASGFSVTSWTPITPVAVASRSRIRVLIERRGSRLTTDSVSLLRPVSAVAAREPLEQRRSPTRCATVLGPVVVVWRPSRCRCPPPPVHRPPP
jgi:hypothetical protein